MVVRFSPAIWLFYMHQQNKIFEGISKKRYHYEMKAYCLVFYISSSHYAYIYYTHIKEKCMYTQKFNPYKDLWVLICSTKYVVSCYKHFVSIPIFKDTIYNSSNSSLGSDVWA